MTDRSSISENCLDDYDCKRAVRNLIRREVEVLTNIQYPEEITAGIAALSAIVSSKTSLQQVRTMLQSDYSLQETSLSDLQAQITILQGDLDQNFYTKTEVDALNADIVTSLASYYTKTEMDAILANIYTKSEIDVIMGALDNFYTKTEIDSQMPTMTNYYTKAEVDTLIQNAVVGDVFNSANYYDKSTLDFHLGTLTTNVAANKELSYYLAYRAAVYAMASRPIREYVYKIGGSSQSYAYQDYTQDIFSVYPYSRFLFLYGNSNYSYGCPLNNWEATNYQQMFYIQQNEYGNGPNGGIQFGEPYITTHPQIKIDVTNLGINIDAAGGILDNALYWKQNQVAHTPDFGGAGHDSDYFAWYLELECTMQVEVIADATARIMAFFVISENPIQQSFTNDWILNQAPGSQDLLWMAGAKGDVYDGAMRTISGWASGKFMPVKIKTRSATYNLRTHPILYFALKFSTSFFGTLNLKFPKVTAKVHLVYKGQNPTGLDQFVADHNMAQRVEHA